MILDTTSKTIEVVLGGTITTNQLEITADWVDTTNGSTFAPGGTSLLTNGGTAVTAVASPAASTQRQVKALTIYNADTVNQTVTVRMFDGTNRRRHVVQSLAPGQSLVFTPEGGWSILSSVAISQIVGTWTPSDASGAGLVLSVTSASYIKIGLAVHVSFFVVYPATANGATAQLTGLPFTSEGPNTRWFGVAPTTATGNARVEPSSNNILPLTNAGATVTNAAMSGISFLGSVVYKSAL